MRMDNAFFNIKKAKAIEKQNVSISYTTVLLSHHSVLRIALDSMTVEKKNVRINIMSDFVVSQSALKPRCFSSVLQLSQTDVCCFW